MALTGLGRGVLSGSVVLFGLCWWLGYRELAILALTGVVLVLAALASVVRAPRAEATRHVRPAKVGRGQSAEGLLTVVNLSGRLLDLRAEELFDGTEIPLPLPPLRRGASEHLRFALPTSKRGLHQVGPLRLIQTDPLGLARHTTLVGEPQQLLVRPHTMDLSTFPAGSQYHPDGSTSDTSVGAAGSFHSLREFVIGDDTRRIHWPTTAKTGQVMIRQVASVAMPSVTVVLDTRLSAYPDDLCFEIAVEAAASIALSATRRGYRVTLHLGSSNLVAASGQQREAGMLLDRLAFMERSATATLPKGRRRTELSVVITGREAVTADEAGVLILRAGNSLEELLARMTFR